METQGIAKMKLSTLLIALGFATLSLTVWELYCRSEQYQIAPSDDKDLWSHQRAKVDKLTQEDIVIIGSSRAMFNFQLDEWEKEQGNKPINIAAAGSTVLPVFKDIVNNSQFNGTLIVGVTPPLYWAPQSPDVIPFNRIQKWVNHYHKRTYADKFNHFIAKNGPQKAFSFLTTSNERFYNELDLRSLIERIPTAKRIPDLPPFPILYQVNDDRNAKLMPQVATDTNYANEITTFWSTVLTPPTNSKISSEIIDDNRKTITKETAELVQKLKNRGGKVIFVRCPSQNKVREIEKTYFPRNTYWDDLVSSSGVPAYHFEDYPFMDKYTLPEWSHLATSDAKSFTKDFVNQLIKDKLL